MHLKMRKKFEWGKGREKINYIKILTEDQEPEINHTNKGRLALKVDAERSAILSQNRMAVMLYKELQCNGILGTRSQIPRACMWMPKEACLVEQGVWNGDVVFR